MSESRSRSPSPSREERGPKKQKTSGGFKWKDKKPKDEGKADERDGGGLDRGYRNRSPRRDSYHDREKERNRPRSPRQNRDGDRSRNGEQRRGAESYRPDSTNDPRPQLSAIDAPTHSTANSNKPSVEDKFNTSTTTSTTNAPATASKPSKPSKSNKPKRSAPTEPMIIVNVNDRLGTKAAIPCLASDSIKAFKAVVAAHIGRQPHEIMLKRQGMRPFKDHLTLADYEISNGVQLDLEVDTGD